METSTDISVLVAPQQWAAAIDKLPATLSASGIRIENAAAEVIDSVCEPDNVLTNEYRSRFGHSPGAEQIYRLVLNAESTLPLHSVTKAVAAAFGNACWYGSTEIGHTEIATGRETSVETGA